MRAAVMTAVNEPLVIEELEPIGLGPYDVIVRTTASGLCHSDLLPLQGLLPMPVPLILGHEGAGVVEEIGSEVRRVKKGDRVIASWVSACGHCYWCLRGEASLCQQNANPLEPKARLKRADGTPITGMTELGTFSTGMCVHETAVVPVQTDLPDEQLALIGCGVTTGVGAAMNTAKVQPGSSVVVFGGGGVGQSIIQGARICGAAEIILVDPLANKREMGIQVGATHTIDPTATDVTEEVRGLTQGRGADYAFEAAGRNDTAGQGFDAIRRGGTLVLVGVQPMNQQPPWDALAHNLGEKKVLGCLYGSAVMERDFPLFVRLAESGRLDVASMVTRRITLDEVNEGLDAIERGEVIRSVIVN